MSERRSNRKRIFSSSLQGSDDEVTSSSLSTRRRRTNSDTQHSKIKATGATTTTTTVVLKRRSRRRISNISPASDSSPGSKNDHVNNSKNDLKMEEFIEESEEEDDDDDDDDLIFSGKVFVFADSIKKKDLQNLVKKSGGIIEKEVTKKTNYCIATNDTPLNDDIISKAKKLKIPILSKQFILDSTEKKLIEPPDSHLLFKFNPKSIQNVSEETFGVEVNISEDDDDDIDDIDESDRSGGVGGDSSSGGGGGDGDGDGANDLNNLTQLPNNVRTTETMEGDSFDNQKKEKNKISYADSWTQTEDITTSGSDSCIPSADTEVFGTHTLASMMNNPYSKSTFEEGSISMTDDFKHLTFCSLSQHSVELQKLVCRESGANFQNPPTFCDLEIHVSYQMQNEKFYCNKGVISSRSSFFRDRLFNNEETSKKRKQTTNRTAIYIDNVISPNAFECLLYYFCTGLLILPNPTVALEIDNLTPNAFGNISIAKQMVKKYMERAIFNIIEMKNIEQALQLLTSITRRISQTNVSATLEEEKTSQLGEILNQQLILRRFICQNIQDLLSSPNLYLNVSYDILRMILESDYLNIPEEDLFEKVISWGIVNCARHNFFKKHQFDKQEIEEALQKKEHVNTQTIDPSYKLIIRIPVSSLSSPSSISITTSSPTTEESTNDKTQDVVKIDQKMEKELELSICQQDFIDSEEYRLKQNDDNTGLKTPHNGRSAEQVEEEEEEFFTMMDRNFSLGKYSVANGTLRNFLKKLLLLIRFEHMDASSIFKQVEGKKILRNEELLEVCKANVSVRTNDTYQLLGVRYDKPRKARQHWDTENRVAFSYTVKFAEVGYEKLHLPEFEFCSEKWSFSVRRNENNFLSVFLCNRVKLEEKEKRLRKSNVSRNPTSTTEQTSTNATTTTTTTSTTTTTTSTESTATSLESTETLSSPIQLLVSITLKSQQKDKTSSFLATFSEVPTWGFSRFIELSAITDKSKAFLDLQGNLRFEVSIERKELNKP